jgi:hypothetical protein
MFRNYEFGMVQTPSLLSRVAPFFFSDVVLKCALGRRCTLLVNGPIVGIEMGRPVMSI